MKKSPSFHSLTLMVLALVLLMSISLPQTVRAQGIVQGNSLPAGAMIAGDGFFSGVVVTIDGNVDGDVFAIGSEININGEVSGSLVTIGKKVTINGAVGGTVYGAAVEFDLAPDANLARNLYLAGLSVNTQAGSQVMRDLYTAALGAQMDGSVDGDVKAIIGPAEFFYLFMDWFNQSTRSSLGTSTLNLKGEGSHDWAITGGAGRLAGPAGLNPISGTWERAINQQAGGIDWKALGNWFLERGRQWLILFLLGAFTFWRMPRLIPGSAQYLRSKPLPSTGWGLLGLVISVNLAGVIILLIVLIVVIGLFLGTITLWELAWSFMALAGFSLGLASTVFALFVMYVCKAIVAYFAGQAVLKRIFPNTAHHDLISLIIGLTIYVFLAAIPLLGWVISLLVTALGIGAAWLFYRNSRGQQSQVEIGSAGDTESLPA